jgi:hypothetical protein
MGELAEDPICTFYRLIEAAPAPQRADRSACGTLPVVAYQYCEPVAAASSFGFYLFPPISFSLVWDGREIAWSREGAEEWTPVRSEPFPNFFERFTQIAPHGMKDLMPAFLSQGHLPGLVQIWSGYLASTAPGWSLLSRGVANLDKTQPYEEHEAISAPDYVQGNGEAPQYRNYEGIIDTDTWLGPAFTTLKLMRINSPIDFHVTRPLFQVQPLRRECHLQPSFSVLEHSALTPQHWRRFEAVARRNTDHSRRPGQYAVTARRRRHREAVG